MKDKINYNILIIEDNLGDYLLLEETLQEKIEEPKIKHAKNFKEAHQILKKEKQFFDIIFLDLTLPDKDGQLLIAEIVSMCNDCPIIVLTGFADFDFSIKTLSLGVSDYLLKDEINSTSLYKSLIYNIERKKTSRELKESETRYSNLFHLSPHPKWIYDELNLKFIQVNKAAIDLYGYSEDEFLKLSMKDISVIEDTDSLRNSMNKTINNKGNVHNNVFRHYNKSKDIIEVEIYSSAITINDMAYRVVIAIDVTEKLLLQKELLEQKIEEQQNIAKAIVKAQEKERAGIGEELHDNINQLLAAAKLYIKSSILQPENSEEYLLKSEEYISTAIEEIRKLSHALIGFSADKVIGIIDSIQKLIDDITKVKNIEFNFDYTNFAEEDTKDELKLVIFRILQEQVSNILKHADASIVDIELKESGTSDLVFSIKDNGKGFNTSSKRDGVGLKNIKNRAELYNGLVDVVSSPGNGCKISIRFKESVI